MTEFPLTAAACAALFLTGLNPATAQVASTEVMSLGMRGVYFVENQGQWSDASVEYGFKTRGLDIAFRESSFTMHLSREIEESTSARRGKGSAPPRIPCVDDWEGRRPLRDEIRGDEDSAPAYEHLTLTVTFPGSNPATPRGAQPQTAKFNYYIGDDESKWASDAPSFAAIIYENLYDGVNLHICGNDDGVLKYEFHVAPGADWNQIRIAYDGIDSLCVDENGDLRIKTSFGTLMDSAPLVWQEDVASTSRAREEAELDVVRDAPLPDRRGSSDQTIPAHFQLLDATTYRFALDGPVDPARTLIIDPDVEWMVYLGGSREEHGGGIACDAYGNVLVTGQTQSTDFEGQVNGFHGGTWDAFVAKICTRGDLLWMTYAGGSSDEWVGGGSGAGIVVGKDGAAFAIGNTLSTDFAGARNKPHGGSDAFVVRVGADGFIEWTIYLGGISGDDGEGITLDSMGNVYVTGGTFSNDFEGRLNSFYGGGKDAFAAQVHPSGELNWMLYLGGAAQDAGSSVAAGSRDNILVVGATASRDFAGRNNSHYGGEDGFVVQIDSDGSLQWMTFIGGSGSDGAADVEVDDAGNALVTGTTWLPDFDSRQNSNHGRSDAFVARIGSSGLINWMIYLGGRDQDVGRSIQISDRGNALIVGSTSSDDFDEAVNTYHGGGDAFLADISLAGDVLWAMYLGGTSDEGGWGLAGDSDQGFFVTGPTESIDFTGMSNTHHGGESDVFLVNVTLASTGAPVLVVDGTCPNGGRIEVSWGEATPDGLCALIFAIDEGTFLIPARYPCQGTRLGLGSNQIQLAGTFRSDGEGNRSVRGFAGNGACGGYLQLLDLSTCGTSNVARIE